MTQTARSTRPPSFSGGTYRQNFREMVDRVAVAVTPTASRNDCRSSSMPAPANLILTIADRVDPFGAARRVFAEVGAPDCTSDPKDGIRNRHAIDGRAGG